MKPRSSLFFSIVLLFCLVQVAWWTWFQLEQSAELERAGELLAAGQVEQAAVALGGTDVESLGEVGRRRQRMFLSESIAFGVLLLCGAALSYAALWREARTRRNQDRFLAGAAHQLNTPLATIRLGLESLQRGSLDESKRARYLQGMLEETSRLEQGVMNLLTAAGLRATGRKLSLERADLADDVREAVAAMQPRCVAGSVTIRASLEASAVRRDRDSMRLIVENLLDNAIKYGGPDRQVEVELRNVGAVAQLRVVDTGRGMTPQECGRVFDPFYRAVDDHIGGAGLGLHLVRELVTAHGGTVRASSAGRGRGSEFCVRIPSAEQTA